MADDIIRRDLDVFWHPCSRMQDHLEFPLGEVVGAEGVRLHLADGSTLLDGISSWWCKSLGHRHPRLLAALAAQADRFEHIIAANTVNARLVRFCERLLAAANGRPPAAWGPAAPPGRLPGRFGKVFLTENGSTAVEVALKLAVHAQARRGHPDRCRFAAFADGYHGETVGALSVGDCERYTRPYRPLLFPVATITGLPRRHGPEDPAWDDAAMEWPAIAAQLDRHAATLAAIVYEPVLQAAGGMRFYSPDLLRRLRSWADAHGVYLVADEIAAGCGRLGPMLASHLAVPGDPAAALPDLACLAKGLSGGVLPLGAVLATDAIYGLCAGLGTAGEETTFLHSTTWCGNALAVAVADAVLDVLVDEGISEAVVRQGRLLRAGFADLARGHLPLTRIRGCGMVAAADLVGPDGGAPDPAARTGLRVCREAIRRGLLLRPLGDTLYLLPPLTSTPAGIDRMLGILGDALRVIAQGG